MALKLIEFLQQFMIDTFLIKLIHFENWSIGIVHSADTDLKTKICFQN